MLMYLSIKLFSISVPVFYLISGLLFFKEGRLDTTLYIKKLKNRIHTLLIPYILWNVIYFGIVAFQQFVIPRHYFLLHKSISDFSWYDYLWIFWDISKITNLADDQHSCLIGAFWFIQCLFVLVVMSPAIYVVIRLLRHAFPIMIVVIYFSGIIPFLPGVHIIAIFYFCIGAYISVMQVSMTDYLKRVSPIVSIFVIMICTISVLYNNDYINFMTDILLILSIYALSAYMLDRERWHINHFLVSSVFFVFAVHRIFTAIFMQLSGNIIAFFGSELLIYLFFLSAIAISVGCSLLVFKIMTIYLPRTTCLLTGNRHYPK